MPATIAPPPVDAAEISSSIAQFIGNARRPALYEPGEDLFPLSVENFSVEMRGSRLTLQAWDRTRNLTRRILKITRSAHGRMELTVERFARREGQLFLVDLGRPAGASAGLKSARLVFRERFRLFLRRQFPQWTLAEITTEANLQHSLSPAFPRALLSHGQHAWAAIACPPESDSAAAVTFGLIWLDYLRGREKRAVVEGLAIYVPAGREHAAALRVLCLDATAARFELFSYSSEDYVIRIDPADHGNLDTRLEPFGAAPSGDAPLFARVRSLPGVECVPKVRGAVSLRVRGVEFAEFHRGELSFGLQSRTPASLGHMPEIESLVAQIAHARSAQAANREHPLYRVAPEAWLESQARASLRILDASLLAEPVYRQTPVLAGGERGIIDLLAVDHSGRLTVLELKASADIHLPLQALDYWLHVKWHLDRGEFAAAGYFPGIPLKPEPPRILLVSPSLEFHPSTETVLRFFSPSIEVERVGLSADWRDQLRVVFRLRGAKTPC
jgi:hypothetical protein